MVKLDEFAARAQTVARQSEVDRAAIAAVGALEAAGIEVLLLKGPVLARTLYRPGEHRGYFDVDLLVAANDRVAAGQVLASLGYLDFAQSSGVQVFPDDPHADLWTRSSERGVVAVDLHWRLPGCDADPERVWSALRAHRARIDLGGARTPILDRPGLALHLALHAAQHGPDDLKVIGDLARGLDRWPTKVWRDAAMLASEVGATEAFSAGLRLLPPGATLASELGLPAARVLLQAIADRTFRPPGTFHLEAFVNAAGLRGRASVLRWSLFPGLRWISRKQPWARISRVHLAAAYALHLARAPGWALRAWRFRRSPHLRSRDHL